MVQHLTVRYACAAVGPSIAADVRQPEKAGPKQPESKLDVLARAHGVTRDVAERYLMACDDKIGDAHKMLQASRASRCHSAVQHS